MEPFEDDIDWLKELYRNKSVIMVAPHPGLGRRFSNTDSIVKANKSKLVHELHTKYPQDYVDIFTHNTLERVKPWIDIVSPIQYPKTLQTPIIDKILVLCADFPDKPAQISTSIIYNRFFGTYINSLKEYYKQVSYSRYISRGEVHGWYRAPNLSTYYTDKQFGFGKYPNSAEKLVEDIVNVASTDPNIDWASFDTNNNGYIDNLFVVHSGAEASWTGDINDFWAHLYIIPRPIIIQQQIIQQQQKLSQEKTVWVYAMTSEYLGKPTDPQIIGSDVHEHGHQLGLPDLYDYTDQSNGVGAYSLMGAGSWGNKGQTPTHLDAWSKYVLGFTDTIENPTGVVHLADAERNPNNVKYTTTDPKEYFLIEVRQKMLYDRYLPSEGLFIWHVNENQQDNNNKNCYLVGLLQADGLKDLENKRNHGDFGDPYPGISNNRSFSPYTNPSTTLCNGTAKNILINYISDSSYIMTFISSLGVPTLITGNLCIKSSPSGASIIIDDCSTSMTTVSPVLDCITGNTIIGMKPGNYTYRLSMIGYKNKTGIFNIIAGKTTTINAGNLALC